MPDRPIDPAIIAKIEGTPADHLAREMANLDETLVLAAIVGRDLPASSLVPVIKAMARRLGEIGDRLTNLQARALMDEGDGR